MELVWPTTSHHPQEVIVRRKKMISNLFHNNELFVVVPKSYDSKKQILACNNQGDLWEFSTTFNQRRKSRRSGLSHSGYVKWVCNSTEFGGFVIHNSTTILVIYSTSCQSRIPKRKQHTPGWFVKSLFPQKQANKCRPHIQGSSSASLQCL